MCFFVLLGAWWCPYLGNFHLFKVQSIHGGQRDIGPSFIDSLSLSPFTLRPTWQHSQVHSQTILALLSFCIIFTFQTCFFKSFTPVKLIPTITVSSQNLLLQTISFPPLPLKRPLLFIPPTNCLMN